MSLALDPPRSPALIAGRASPRDDSKCCAADCLEGRFTTGAYCAVAVSANFDDSYQIHPDLSIRKCGYRNHA